VQNCPFGEWEEEAVVVLEETMRDAAHMLVETCWHMIPAYFRAVDSES
jgi:hypothetical protein